MRKLFKKEPKKCYYCNKNATKIKCFEFPIDCVCCSEHHIMEVNYCDNCKPSEPTIIAVALFAHKVADPIHEKLFIKVP